MNWQSIETAPKDGTHILLFIEDQVTEGWWEEGYTWKTALLSSHGCGCCADDNEEPTHWAVLDTPKKEQAQ